MQLKPLAALRIPAQNGYLLQVLNLPASSCTYGHLIWNRPLTVERKASTGSILAPPIFCHAFVSARVFLLEIGYFKDGVWILHLDFAGEGNAAGSPPAYFWDGAVKTNKTFPWWQLSVTVIKVWWGAEERSRSESLVNYCCLQIKAWLLRFPEELWFLLHCLFMLSGGLMDLRMTDVTLVHS